MEPVSQKSTSSTSLPKGYVEKTEGTIAPNDLVWDSDEERFRAPEQADISTPAANADRVATPAYWVTYDGTTGTVWGVGESPTESIQAAKFEAFGDDHGAVGYEVACWCEELSTKVCSETLYTKARGSDPLSLSDDRLRKHVVTDAVE